MTYRLLSNAINDLEEIEIYTTQSFGAAIAARTEERLFRTFQLLAEYPELGRRRPDITPKSVRFLFRRPFYILYQPQTPISIHRILHPAMNLSKHI